MEKEPTKRWKSADFKALSIDESTARRQFKKRFGISFVTFSRARRIGEAMKEIRTGSSVIDAQLQAGYESGNGSLGGYGGGLNSKQWLLEHEKRHKKG